MTEQVKPNNNKGNIMIWTIVVALLLIEALEYNNYIEAFKTLISLTKADWNGWVTIAVLKMLWNPIALILFALRTKAGWYMLCSSIALGLFGAIFGGYILIGEMGTMLDDWMKAIWLITLLIYVALLTVLVTPAVRSKYNITKKSALFTIALMGMFMLSFVQRFTNSF